VALIDTSASWTHERIRAHLLLAPPFLNGQEGYIRIDTKSSPLQEYPCRIWSLFVLAVTEVLLDHFTKLSIISSLPQEVAQQTETALRHLDARLSLYFDLQERKALPPAAKRYVHEPPIFKKFQKIAKLVRSITSVDNDSKDLLKRAIYPRFYYELHAAFRTYGPVIRRTRFSREARYRACAAILLHFNLATGCLSTLADTFGRCVRTFKLNDDLYFRASKPLDYDLHFRAPKPRSK